jgi:hypothetical protein
MIQYASLLILNIIISTYTVGTIHAYQNISEDIYKMFSNLTPEYLGVKDFSSEPPGGFLISSMQSINTSNNLITNIE